MYEIFWRSKDLVQKARLFFASQKCLTTPEKVRFCFLQDPEIPSGRRSIKFNTNFCMEEYVRELLEIKSTRTNTVWQCFGSNTNLLDSKK